DDDPRRRLPRRRARPRGLAGRARVARCPRRQRRRHRHRGDADAARTATAAAPMSSPSAYGRTARPDPTEEPMAFRPYLFFGGNCRQAMTRYQEIFGGELTVMSMKDARGDEPPPADQADLVIHAGL